MLIFLIGYMGSGKTKTGEALSRKLHLEFADTDRLIESLQQKSISQIFSDSDEAKFRLLERDILHSFSERENLIVSTGGGLPCFHDNMNWMNENGFTVYLKVPEGMLVQRLKEKRGGRPLLADLTADELTEKVHQQIKERKSYYEQAKLIYDASQMNINTLIQKIQQAV